MDTQTAVRWIPVALSADLEPAMAVPATTPGAALALWRSRSGRVTAVADRCPHRGMRLSHGFVRGEALSCIYHGWRYGTDGHCLRIPAHPGLRPPDAIRVQTFPVAEAGGLIWVAEGEPAVPPPALKNLMPVRSLAVAAGRDALEGAAGGRIDADGLLSIEAGGVLLVADQGGPETLVHLLVAAGSSGTDARIAASRAAERVRIHAESSAAERAA